MERETAFILSTDRVQIGLLKARELHINYLEKPPHVKTDDGKIIHSLLIPKENLRALCEYGKDGGIRLYFCKHDLNKPESINIIAVPVMANGENDVRLDNNGELPAIFNTLEPCPTVCKAFSEHDLNCHKLKVDGSYRWCLPNEKEGDTIWFSKTSGGTKHPANKPSENEIDPDVKPRSAGMVTQAEQHKQ